MASSQLWANSIGWADPGSPRATPQHHFDQLKCLSHAAGEPGGPLASLPHATLYTIMGSTFCHPLGERTTWCFRSKYYAQPDSNNSSIYLHKYLWTHFCSMRLKCHFLISKFRACSATVPVWSCRKLLPKHGVMVSSASPFSNFHRYHVQLHSTVPFRLIWLSRITRRVVLAEFHHLSCVTLSKNESRVLVI